jgi:hypothetical protein
MCTDERMDVRNIEMQAEAEGSSLWLAQDGV